MDDRPKDPDMKALEAMSHSPPRRKVHSYSQQLRPKGGGPQPRHAHHPRNHSLDEIEILGGAVNSSDEEDFYRYPITTGSVGGAIDMIDCAGMGNGVDGCDDSLLLPNQALPEFMGSGVLRVRYFEREEEHFEVKEEHSMKQ